MYKTAKVLDDGVLAALLSETDEGYLLQYNSDYLQHSDSKPISLTFKYALRMHTLLYFNQMGNLGN